MAKSKIILYIKTLPNSNVQLYRATGVEACIGGHFLITLSSIFKKSEKNWKSSFQS